MIVKHEDGVVRVSTMPGMWRTYANGFLAMVGECKLELKVDLTSRGLLSAQSRGELKLDAAAISRIARGLQPMPASWISRFHVWSGLSLQDLESLSGITSDVQPHHNRRK